MDLSGYNIQGSSDVAKMIARNNRRLIGLRWYYMALLACLAAVVSLLSTGQVAHAIEYVSILLIGYTFNLLLFLFNRIFEKNRPAQYAVMNAQLLLDLVMCGIIMYVQGGVMARTTLLFAIPIIASGLTFSSRVVLPVASAAGLMYIGVVLLYEYTAGQTPNWSEVAVPLAFYPLLFLVIGRMVQFLTLVEIDDTRERAYNSFLSLLAHQLKHPASATKTIIDVMEHDKNTKLAPQSQHYLEMLRGENENQIRLIDNLLEAAPRRQLDAHLEKVDLTIMLEKVAHQTAIGHQRLGDLMKERSVPQHVTVLANAIKLKLALINIFDNCFRHTKEGSPVYYTLKKRGTVVEVVIRDEGAGISQAQLENISKRFAAGTVHSLDSGHVGGLGLGLYTANQVIAAQGGTLTIQSKENRGTTITIRMKGAK